MINNKNINSLVNAEYDFAARSGKSGIRNAFLSFLSEESIVFRPNPVNGKKWYMEKSEIPGELSWYPILADISIAGDLGYTTGPWEYHNKNEKGESVSAYGHYVSVWRKQPDGKWKVEIDVGISHSKPESIAAKLTNPNSSENLLSSNQTKHKTNFELLRNSIIQADMEFSRLSEQNGFYDAFNIFSSPSVRLYRENLLPVIDKSKIDLHLYKTDEKMRWQPHGSRVSASGDLGYTYGIAEFLTNKNSERSNSNNTGSYLRIWKKENNKQWKVVLDILNPIPDAVD